MLHYEHQCLSRPEIVSTRAPEQLDHVSQEIREVDRVSLSVRDLENVHQKASSSGFHASFPALQVLLKVLVWVV